MSVRVISARDGLQADRAINTPEIVNAQLNLATNVSLPVHVAPEIAENLLSIGQLCDSGYTCVFNATSVAAVPASPAKPSFYGTRKANGLYYFRLPPGPNLPLKPSHRLLPRQLILFKTGTDAMPTCHLPRSHVSAISSPALSFPMTTLISLAHTVTLATPPMVHSQRNCPVPPVAENAFIST